MAVKSIILRQWNPVPARTRDLKITTKFTDLGTPETNKHVYGYYCNVSVDFDEVKESFTSNTFSNILNKTAYNFNLFIRKSPHEGWQLITNLSNNFKSRGNTRLVNKLRHTGNIPSIQLMSVQMKIESVLVNPGFGINDFGLIYRLITPSSTESHDEN